MSQAKIKTLTDDSGAIVYPRTKAEAVYGLENIDGRVEELEVQLDSKSDSGHKHDAGDITSGTLAVARGGTGVTSNPSMLTNLGSTTAASVFAASPRPGITGTLPVANGGTGATTLANVKTNLEIPVVYASTAAPTASDGKNGDIWLVYS